MSRSFRNKCGKGWGFEYGSRREGNKNHFKGPGKYGGSWVKRETNRLERRNFKNRLIKETRNEE